MTGAQQPWGQEAERSHDREEKPYPDGQIPHLRFRSPQVHCFNNHRMSKSLQVGTGSTASVVHRSFRHWLGVFGPTSPDEKSEMIFTVFS